LGFHLCTVLPIVILTIIYNEQTNEWMTNKCEMNKRANPWTNHVITWCSKKNIVTSTNSVSHRKKLRQGAKEVLAVHCRLYYTLNIYWGKHDTKTSLLQPVGVFSKCACKDKSAKWVHFLLVCGSQRNGYPTIPCQFPLFW
jgi:hypothetical protein